MFTAAPPLAMGLFDKVCSAETHLAHPGLYATKNSGLSSFNIKVIYISCNRNIITFISFFYEITISCLYLGILGMDCECFNTFISALLVISVGSERRCGMGKW